MKLWKDTLIGVLAGLVAVGVLMFRRTEVNIPPGIYQAQFDQARYREVAESLRGPASASATQQKLQRVLTEVRAKDVPLENALAYLQELSGVEIRVEWGVLDAARVPRDIAVSIDMRKVPAATALREMLGSAGRLGTRLAYQVEGDVVRVSTAAALSKELLTRAYDVGDIVRAMVEKDRALSRPGRVPPGVGERADPFERVAEAAKNLVGPGVVDPLLPDSNFLWVPLSEFDFVTSPDSAVAAISRTLRENVDPKSWTQSPAQGSLRYFAGKLIVTQTRQNQEEVAMWLEWIRQAVTAK